MTSMCPGTVPTTLAFLFGKVVSNPRAIIVVPDMDDPDAQESFDIISKTLLESPADHSYDTSNPASLVGTNCSGCVWEPQTHKQLN